MTSAAYTNNNTSFSAKIFDRSLFLNNLRRNKIFMIIIGIVLGVSCPLIGYIVRANSQYVTDQTMNVLSQALGVTIIILAVTFAFILGLHAMNYTHNKTSAIFYNSLPIKKTCLFSTQFISGVIYFFIPLAVIYILSLVLCVGYTEAMKIMTLSFMWAALLFLLIYSFTVLAANISGNILNSCVVWCYLGFYATGFIAMAGVFIQAFYPFTSPNVLFSESVITKTSPMIFFIWGIAKSELDSFALAEAGLVAGLLLFTAAFYTASMFLNKINKTENAGKSINFVIFERIFKYSTLTLTAIVGGTVFYSVSSVNFAMFIFGILISSFIAFMLMNFIIRKNIRETFKGIKNYCIFAVTACVILSLFSLDVFGFDKYMPKANAVDSITFNRHYTPKYSSHFWESDRSYSYNRYIGNALNNMIVEDRETIALIHDVFTSAMKIERWESLRWQWSYYDDKVVRYPAFSQGDITFKRGNGFNAIKKFPHMLVFKNEQDREEYDVAVDKLYNNEAWRKAVFYPIFDDGYFEYFKGPPEIRVYLNHFSTTEYYVEDDDVEYSDPKPISVQNVAHEERINMSQLAEIFENARKDILNLSSDDILSGHQEPTYYWFEIFITHSFEREDEMITLNHSFSININEKDGEFTFPNLMNYLGNIFTLY